MILFPKLREGGKGKTIMNVTKVAHLVRQGRSEGISWRVFIIEKSGDADIGVYTVDIGRTQIDSEHHGRLINAMFLDHTKWIEELGHPRSDCGVVDDPSKIRHDHMWMVQGSTLVIPWLKFIHYHAVVEEETITTMP